MKVIECPSCGSKFKVNEAALQKESVKLRCSQCAHVFTYQAQPELSLEQEFESLLSGEGQKPQIEDFELEETPAPPLTESGQPESKVGPLGVPFKDTGKEAQPESVIREIDSILGAGEEIGTYKPSAVVLEEEELPTPRYWLWVIVVILVFGLGLGVFIFRDKIPFLGKSGSESSDLERGPFFQVPGNSITYEIVNNHTEGTALVVKGLVQKLPKRPLKSLLVEVRIYDRNKVLLGTKTTYAGILPDREEFITKKQDDIDALLSAEPQSLGALTMAVEIPFAVAFFGKPALEGTTFQVEVKEFRWQ